MLWARAIACEDRKGCSLACNALQAIARIYRFGQQMPTFIYRLLYTSAIDHRIYRRNIDKEALFNRVVDKRAVKGAS